MKKCAECSCWECWLEFGFSSERCAQCKESMCTDLKSASLCTDTLIEAMESRIVQRAV
jgi:hypothetical protein